MWRRASGASPRLEPEGNRLLRRILLVAFFLEVGLLLIVLPWSGFWEGNYFGHAWPTIGPLLTNDFIRGAVSGLGVVNVVAGFFELVPALTLRGGPSDSTDSRS
jgi:polyferredoxin